MRTRKYEGPRWMSGTREDVEEARVANIYNYENFVMYKQSKFCKKF